MFTLLRNYKNMFNMCLASYQQGPEGQAQIEAAVQDEKLNYSEIQDLAKLPPEMQQAIIDKMTGELELTSDIASGLGDVNPVDREVGESLDSHKTIQFMLSLAQKLDGTNLPGGIDGIIGTGTKGVLKEHVSSYDGGVITQSVITELVNVVNTKIVARAEKIAEAEQERQDALTLVSQYESVDEIKALDEDKRKEIQEALKTLGYYKKAIDGNFGKGSIAAFNGAQGEIKEFKLKAAEEAMRLAENNITNIQGPNDAASVILQRDEAEENLETLQKKYANKADVYSRVEVEGDLVPHNVKEALKNDPEGKKLLCQIQRDLKTLGYYTGSIDGHKGIDYGFGAGTAKAFTTAKTELGFTDLKGLRRAAKLAEVKAEAENNSARAGESGRTNEGLDLVAQSIEDGYTQGDLEAFLAEYKVTADMPDELREQSDMTQIEREELREKQRAWVIDEAIAMGHRQRAGNGRKGVDFIEGLANHGDDRLEEVMPNLVRNFTTEGGKTALAEAMMNGVSLTATNFERGATDTEDFEVLEIAGVIIDTKLLDSAYIATGSDATQDIDGSWQRGTMEVPIWLADGEINPKFAELTFSNATYINGAIVMTMENGCEGNLVIIPVERDKYIPPKPKPKPVITPIKRIPRNSVSVPEQPIEVIQIPDELGNLRSYGRCSGEDWIEGEYFDGGTWFWTGDDVNIWHNEIENDPRCVRDDDPTGGGGNGQSSTPGETPGGPNGGGNGDPVNEEGSR